MGKTAESAAARSRQNYLARNLVGVVQGGGSGGDRARGES